MHSSTEKLSNLNLSKDASSSIVSNIRHSKPVAELPNYSRVDSSTAMMSTISSGSHSKVSFTDREVHEIKVAKETFFKEPKEKISPRIASIQKMLANPGTIGQEAAAVNSVEVKKSTPPPPPPRHGVVPKSSTNVKTVFNSQTQKDAIKPMLPLPGKKIKLKRFHHLNSLLVKD